MSPKQLCEWKTTEEVLGIIGLKTQEAQIQQHMMAPAVYLSVSCSLICIMLWNENTYPNSYLLLLIPAMIKAEENG